MKWFWFVLCLETHIAAVSTKAESPDQSNISSTQELKKMQNDSCDSCKTQDTTTNIFTTCITPSTSTVTTVPVLPTTTLADQYTPTVMPSTPSPPNNSSVTSTLIAITAILFISLVAVITGWAVTCFVAIKKGRITYKISQGRSRDNSTLQQLSHLRDREPCPLPQVNHYSSLGPDYEVVGNRRRVHWVAQTDSTNNEATNPNHEYHELELAEEHTYHVLDCHSEGDQNQTMTAAQAENKERKITVTSYEVPITLTPESKEDNSK